MRRNSGGAAVGTPGSRRAAIIISYTCPRCREVNRASRCRQCGWDSRGRTARSRRGAGHEDRIIAC